MLLPDVACECLFSECKTTPRGRYYQGTMTTTTGGYECRLWSLGSNFPPATVDSNFPDGSVAAAGNYCRNPDGDHGGPWCHITHPTTNWAYCPVPLCSGKCIYMYFGCHM